MSLQRPPRVDRKRVLQAGAELHPEPPPNGSDDRGAALPCANVLLLGRDNVLRATANNMIKYHAPDRGAHIEGTTHTAAPQRHKIFRTTRWPSSTTSASAARAGRSAPAPFPRNKSQRGSITPDQPPGTSRSNIEDGDAIQTCDRTQKAIDDKIKFRFD